MAIVSDWRNISFDTQCIGKHTQECWGRITDHCGVTTMLKT